MNTKQKILYSLAFCCWGLAAALLVSGCASVLESTLAQKAVLNTRLSGIGVVVDSAAATPGTPKAIIGVGEIAYTLTPTAQGEIRSPAVINRTAVRGPIGTDAASTSGIGDVGDELGAAGEHGSRALEALHPD